MSCINKRVSPQIGKITIIAFTIFFCTIYVCPSANAQNAEQTEIAFAASMRTFLNQYEEDKLHDYAFQASQRKSAGSPSRIPSNPPSSTNESDSIPFSKSDWSDFGITPISSDSSTSINTIAKEPNGNITISASVKSSITFSVATDTTLVIAGEKRQEFTQSSLDKRTITATNTNGRIEVLNDTLDNEYNDSEPEQISSNAALPITSSLTNGAAATTEFGTNSAGLNYITAMKYADKWSQKAVSTGDGTQDVMNPAFPIYDNNCTNFVSQILYTGGLPLRGGSLLQAHDTSVWTWRLTGSSKASRTWSAANYNYTYMKDHSNSFTPDSNPMHAWQGSIIYADWQNNGELDHAMFVVGYIANDLHVSPIIDQMTVPRHDYMFTASVIQSPAATTYKTLLYKYE